jgi:DNA-binding response OmpR family regulator
VQRLRGKLGEHADWIETVRGFGYRFRTEPPR